MGSKLLWEQKRVREIGRQILFINKWYIREHKSTQFEHNQWIYSALIILRSKVENKDYNYS